MSKKASKQLSLKPQDLLVVLKLCSDESIETAPYAALADCVGMTASETHAAVERAEVAGLVRTDPSGRYALRDPVAEFVVHGAKYAFPVARGRLVRGVPTSYGARPLSSHFAATSEPAPVWPSAKGEMRGPSISPLYSSVPNIVFKDERLYEILALLDAVREGRARERKIATSLLEERLR